MKQSLIIYHHDFDFAPLLTDFHCFFSDNHIGLSFTVRLLPHEGAIKYVETKKGKRLDPLWFDLEFTYRNHTQFDHIAFMMNRTKYKKQGGERNLYGYQPHPNTRAWEYVIFADEKEKREGMKQPVYTLIHEIAHGLSEKLGKADRLHEWVKEGKFVEYFTEYLGLSQSDDDTDELTAKRNGLIEKALGLAQKLLGIYRSKLQEVDNPWKIKPALYAKAIELIERARLEGFDLRITSGFRSAEEQNSLYAQGRTTKGPIITNAKAGESPHNTGDAFDLVDRKKGYDIDWKRVGEIGKSLDLEWGGDWKNFQDNPHFQTKGWRV